MTKTLRKNHLFKAKKYDTGADSSRWEGPLKGLPSGLIQPRCYAFFAVKLWGQMSRNLDRLSSGAAATSMLEAATLQC
jgi:hypothetical protein